MSESTGSAGPTEGGILFLRHRGCGRPASVVRGIPQDRCQTIAVNLQLGWFQREEQCPQCGERLHFDVEQDWRKGTVAGLSVPLLVVRPTASYRNRIRAHVRSKRDRGAGPGRSADRQPVPFPPTS